MKKKILGLAALLTLSSSVALAAPKPGVYQQMYADGRLKSVVTILHNPGTSDFMAQYSMGDKTYVALDVMDKNGKVLEEFATEYDEDIPAVYGYTINASNLRKAEQKDWFSVQANKKSNLKLDCSQENKLIVAGAGALYDGEYYFSPRSEVQANHALLLYGYEATRNRQIPSEGTGAADSYNINELPKAPWINTLEIKRNNTIIRVMLDNGFNIVMPYTIEGNSTFKPFFMSDKYAAWSEAKLAPLKEGVNFDTSALYMHAYIARNYPELAKGNNLKLIQKDFYGGEGENAIFTKAYELERFVDGDVLKAGSAYHSDNGNMQVKSFVGKMTVTGDEVRVRQSPNTNCAIMGYVNRGDEVTILGVTEDLGWARVKLGEGRLGYISARFISGLNSL